MGDAVYEPAPPTAYDTQSQVGCEMIEDFGLVVLLAIQVITMGALLFQALNLSVRTMFARHTAKYWQSFLISLGATVVNTAIEVWAISNF